MSPTSQQTHYAVVIASPRVYRDEATLSQISTRLQNSGITIAQICPVASLDGKPPMAALWQEAGVDLVIAAGGDGSIGCAATHVAWSGLPLGILPLGTSNDFARSLRLPLDMKTACQTIAQGRLMTLDLGYAQPAAAAPYALHQAEEQANPAAGVMRPAAQHAFFTHALTLGLNVTFARLATNMTLRQHFGPLTYPVAALGTLSVAKPMDFTLTFHNPACPLEQDGSCTDEVATAQPYHYQALQVAVVNSPVFGGQLEFALAGVELHDHLLDIVIVEKFDKRQLLAAAQTALTPAQDGRREAVSSLFPGIRHLKARAITIETARPMDVTLDGELRGRTPIHVVSAARALKVFVPAERSGPQQPISETAQEESRGTSSG